MDDDLSLVAFIATWLAFITVPSTLMMASFIVCEERIALTPATLTYLYHGLGKVSIVIDSQHFFKLVLLYSECMKCQLHDEQLLK